MRLCPTSASCPRPSLSSLQKKRGSRSILLCPCKLAETEAAMQPAGIRGKTSTGEPAASRGGQHHTQRPGGGIRIPAAKQHGQIHRLAMPSGGRMLPAHRRHNQALVCSQTAQVLWLLAPKPGDPLAEPWAWEDGACASIKRQGCFCLQAAGNGAAHPASSPSQERAPRKEITRARRFDGMSPLGGLKIAINGELSLIAFV